MRLDVLDKMMLEVIAYNEMADFCYKEFNNDDTVMIYGLWKSFNIFYTNVDFPKKFAKKT